MPRQLALLLYLGLIGLLFRADLRHRRAGSWALLIPGAWLAILGSRPLGYWFGGTGGAGAGDLEGSSLNVLVQGGLMLAALVVLVRRGLDWAGFLSRNKVLVLIYLYFAASAAWSEYPVSTLKRIVRDFGCVIVALVFLTEPDPFRAARIVFVRCAYLLFPLSVLLIKYYPQLGRMYSKSWGQMYTGVTFHKNSLGAIIVVFGLMTLLDLLELRRGKDRASRSWPERVRWLVILMGLWLLWMSDSATSVLCVVLGLLILWSSHYIERLRSPRRVVAVGVAAALGLAVLQAALGLSSLVIQALGRNETLTGRTDIWQMVTAQKPNPVIGWGFMSFWDMPAALAYNEAHGTHLVTAHNGYLDAYVDGGALGLLLLLGMLLAGGIEALRGLLSGTWFGRARFMFLCLAITYNWSESDFFRLQPLWFVLLLCLIEYRHVPAVARNLAIEMNTVGVQGRAAEVS